MPFTFGNAFNRFFRLLGGNFVPFAIVGLICTIAPSMALVYTQATYMGINQGDPTWLQKLAHFTPQLWAFAGVGWLVMLLFNLMSVSAITEISILRSVDKPVNYAAVIGNALKNALPLLIVEILTVLLLVFGFILLIIPGFFFMLCTCVAVPAYVGQPSIGIVGALQKSFALTRNHRWALLLLFIVMGILSSILSGALVGTTMSLPGGMMSMPALLARGFISGIIALLGHVLAASVYVSLREDKEKTTPDAAASVF